MGKKDDILYVHCRRCLVENRVESHLDVIIFEGDTLMVMCQVHPDHPVMVMPYTGPTPECELCKTGQHHAH